MLAGKLQQRIAFDSRAVTDDGAGNHRADWVNQFSLWARRRYDSGREAVEAAKLSGIVGVTLVVRNFPNSRRIGTDWRCRDPRTGEVFNIRAILPSETPDYIVLKCDKGAASDG